MSPNIRTSLRQRGGFFAFLFCSASQSRLSPDSAPALQYRVFPRSAIGLAVPPQTYVRFASSIVLFLPDLSVASSSQKLHTNVAGRGLVSHRPKREVSVPTRASPQLAPLVRLSQSRFLVIVPHFAHRARVQAPPILFRQLSSSTFSKAIYWCLTRILSCYAYFQAQETIGS